MAPDTNRAAARQASTIPSAGSSCSSTQWSGPKHFLQCHQQGTPLGPCLPGNFVYNDGQEYVVSSTRASSSTKLPNLPAAPGSLRPVRDSLLSLLNASSTPLERQLAIFTYLSIGEEAMRQVLQAEEAAAAIQARYTAKVSLSRTGSGAVVKVKLDKSFARDKLSAKQYGKQAITGSDALANPASQAGLTSRPQAWEAGELLAQFSKGKEAMATTIATTLETLANGRNTRPGLDLCAVPEQLQPFAVGLLHKAGACSAYALPVYQQQLPLGRWLSQQQYTYLVSHHSSAQLCYDFQPTYWDTAVEAVPHPFPLFAPGRLAKALLAVPPASLLRHCCLPGMPSLAAAAEQLGLAPAGAAAAAANAAASASSGMGMLRRIWCSQLLRLRPGVMLRLLAARALLQLQPAVPLLAGSACSSEVAVSSGQGGGGAGSAPTAVGADEEGSKAAEAAAVLPPSRRQQGGSRQRIIGRQLRRLGGLVGRALLLRVC
ncbi:hypothetical protein OEZ86_006744 [Tetradesmus obliquus]|nr:hypothetical protein OEZ86_006744 [Tetradesmus obliquus]